LPISLFRVPFRKRPQAALATAFGNPHFSLMARHLKVFRAHLGFYDTAVAAPSRAAALKAWGSRQNLFREGVASETKDAQAVTAALAKPGVVLRRPVGSNVAFSENPGLPQIPNAPKKKPPSKVQTKSAPPPEPPPRHDPPRLRLVSAPRPQPDRAPIEAAEKALAALKDEEQGALAAIEKRKAALDEEARRQRADFRERRERCEKALSDARKAYQHALSRT
jgi:colicin import membrane protein